MKIVFMGTPDFAVGALEALIQAGEEITCVVTQPDKPKGRGKELAMPPVKECALKYNLPVYQPVKIKTEESIAYLRTVEADVFVVAAFGQILSEEILNMPKYGCINIHASLLPKYRGAAPIQWAILNGEEKTGVTIMQMDKGLDTGDMLLKREIPIAADETGESLFEKLSVLGAELIKEALPMLEKGELKPEPQPKEEASFYARMLKKEDGLIDWSETGEELERKIRGLYSWPMAYTFLGGKKLILCKAETSDLDKKAEPGTIIEVTKNDFTVQAGKGSIKVLAIKPQGKKEMSTHDYLLGNRTEPGEKCLRQEG